MDHRGIRVVAFGQWAGVAGRCAGAFTSPTLKFAFGVTVWFLFSVARGWECSLPIDKNKHAGVTKGDEYLRLE